MPNELELVIDRPMPNHFYWTIVRGLATQDPEIVAHASGPLPSEKVATAQGMLALPLMDVDKRSVPVVHAQLDPRWNVVTEPGRLA